MIILGTHIWVWWVHGDTALTTSTRTMLDPADQIIVATSRVLDAPLVTVNGKILGYPHVRLAPTNP